MTKKTESETAIITAEEMTNWLSGLHKRFPVEDIRGGFYRLTDAQICFHIESLIGSVVKAREIIYTTLDSQPDTDDPVQHNKWLVAALEEIERELKDG